MKRRAVSVLAVLGIASAQDPRPADCSIFKKPTYAETKCDRGASVTFVDDGMEDPRDPERNTTILDLAFEAFSVMQRQFWAHQRGTWPTAIDWTAAFIQTAHSGMTASLSSALAEMDSEDIRKDMVENMMASYFAEMVAFYFGQHDKAILGQANDDILWVVLGWLEATSFIRGHSRRQAMAQSSLRGHSLADALKSQPWHGNAWNQAFAARQRSFWDAASKGWSTDLCGGGMIWDPHPKISPYKNAITNELYIAASAKMYLEHPNSTLSSDGDAFYDRRRTHLRAALEGYRWLKNINMTNSAGLYVDGFHISNWKRGGRKCDERNEAVYTYNQGVLLTGQRGLWEATGILSFLEDGHRLIQAVIRATGWDLHSNSPLDNVQHMKLSPFHGIGRGGIIEERCDTGGHCSQNSQTFKGIYFHHLTLFCRPITENFTLMDEAEDEMLEKVAKAHARACKRYLLWVGHNAEAALMTRDKHGVFGQWWGAKMFPGAEEVLEGEYPKGEEPGPGVVDYRNEGIPQGPNWTEPDTEPPILPGILRPPFEPAPEQTTPPDQPRTTIPNRRGRSQQHLGSNSPKQFRHRDPNERGRGRTVETQNSGMSVLRCWWELTRAYSLVEGRRKEGWGFGRFHWLFSRMWNFLGIQFLDLRF